jgi:hypothetical protein
VRELNDESAIIAKLDKAWILSRMMRNAEMALGDVPDASGTRERDATAANRALELLGRELGMFVDRKMEVKDELDLLSPDQRLALIQAMRAALEAREAPVIEASSTAAPPPNRRRKRL